MCSLVTYCNYFEIYSTFLVSRTRFTRGNFCLIVFTNTINNDYAWYNTCRVWLLDIRISTCSSFMYSWSIITRKNSMYACLTEATRAQIIVYHRPSSNLWPKIFDRIILLYLFNGGVIDKLSYHYYKIIYIKWLTDFKISFENLFWVLVSHLSNYYSGAVVYM